VPTLGRAASTPIHRSLQGRHNHTMNSHYPPSWYADSAPQLAPLPTLQGNISADVCVVGGGYTGLSTALHLRQLGFSVALLEANRVAWGASGRNGGHVGTGQRADQATLEKMVGHERASRLWQLSLDAVALVEDLCQQFAIDCELGTGNLHLAAKRAHIGELEEEVHHLRQQYGYEHIEFLDQQAVAQRTSAQGVYAGVLDRGARHLHPLKYALGLARAALSLGSDIYEHSRVKHYRTSDQKVIVSTDQGQVRCSYLVLACNGYLGGLENRIAGNIMPINNFMIATEPLSEALADQVNRDRLSLSDTLFVINYWKLSADRRMLFGGGETYSSRFPSDIKNFVRPYMLQLYPELADVAITHGWGGTLGITLNRMPDFGRIDKHTFYAQGFSGHGVPTATFAGKLLASAIHGDCTDFDLMAAVPTRGFPGGTLLRWPGLVAGMLFYSLLDRWGR